MSLYFRYPEKVLDHLKQRKYSRKTTIFTLYSSLVRHRDVKTSGQDPENEQQSELHEQIKTDTTSTRYMLPTFNIKLGDFK